jgi:hypothetical protein
MVAIPANKTPAHHSKTTAVQGPATLRAFTAAPPGWRGAGKLAPVVVVLGIATARRRSALLEREKIALADHEITPTGGFQRGEPFNLPASV